MRETNQLQVWYEERKVVTLALTLDRRVAFEYDEAWLEEGFSISPFSLPLRKQVFIPTKPYFHGLFGVFADSLPDAWGNILLNRMLKEKGINADEINMLDRLAIIGNAGMGALCYRPEKAMITKNSTLNLDYLAGECKKILASEYTQELDKLYQLGGTSGGARPKILTKIDEEEWMIKFPAHVDAMNVGKMEYDYSLCAKRCGISMAETQLFPSEICEGYFGTKRFDRYNINGKCKKVHMLTAAALLELDFEQPSLDYHSLMKLTKILTRDKKQDVEEMFRRMCFNVFAHNRDDHSKNFTYIYHDNEKQWRLSPAYDLTYSNTYYGEHTTTVDGNGKNPGSKELLAVGVSAGLKKKECENIIIEIKTYVKEDLGEIYGC